MPEQSATCSPGHGHGSTHTTAPAVKEMTSIDQIAYVTQETGSENLFRCFQKITITVPTACKRLFSLIQAVERVLRPHTKLQI